MTVPTLLKEPEEVLTPMAPVPVTVTVLDDVVFSIVAEEVLSPTASLPETVTEPEFEILPELVLIPMLSSPVTVTVPVFAIVDTNSNPDNVDYVIPANDDANKSVEVILEACCAAIAEGLEERKAEKVDAEAAGEGEGKNRKRSAKARVEKTEEAEESVEASTEEA